MRKKFKVNYKKVNKVLQHIPAENITKLNKLIYSGVKIASNKIGITLRNLSRNTKPEWEMRLEGQIKKLR